MIKTFSALALAGILAGCASGFTYTYNGEKYENEELFQAAVNQNKTLILAPIQPLSAPITEKKLVAVIPNIETISNEILGRYAKQLTRTIQPNEKLMANNLGIQAYKDLRLTFEAVEKRGIYKSVEIRDTASLTPSPEPAADYDVLYYTQPNPTSGQYFYSSLKHGKQVFAYDMSGGTPQAKTAAFIEAVQAMAIRN